MAEMKKIMCFTHYDLDGVISYMILKWKFPKAQIDCVPTNAQSFREEYGKWLSKNDPDDYDEIYILDLGVFKDKDIVDDKRFFIIDHHDGHNNSTYEHARCAINTSCGSACLWLYKVFGKLYDDFELTKARK